MRTILHRAAVLSMLAAVAITGAGCGTPGGLPATSTIGSTIAAVAGFTVTQNQLDAARNGYDGAVLAPLATYATLPRCRTGQTITAAVPCHDRALLKKIRAADRVAERAFTNAQAAISSGNNSGISAAWSALQSAIDSAKQLIAIAGV